MPSLLSWLSGWFKPVPEYIARDRRARKAGYHVPKIVIGYTFDTSIGWGHDEPKHGSLGICNPDWIPEFTDDDPKHQRQVEAAINIIKAIAQDRSLVGSVQVVPIDPNDIQCLSVEFQPRQE